MGQEGESPRGRQGILTGSALVGSALVGSALVGSARRADRGRLGGATLPKARVQSRLGEATLPKDRHKPLGK
jgi:hypothetical protein